jgi:hypothetical protein
MSTRGGLGQESVTLKRLEYRVPWYGLFKRMCGSVSDCPDNLGSRRNKLLDPFYFWLTCDHGSNDV